MTTMMVIIHDNHLGVVVVVMVMVMVMMMKMRMVRDSGCIGRDYKYRSS